MEKKLFTEKQIDLSALLAGPIPPGFLIFKNYMVLGKEKQAFITLAGTFLFTVLFFYALFQVPDAIMDKIPNFVFTAFYGILVFFFFKFFMAKQVNQAFEEGAKKRSNWGVTGITILGVALNLAIIFGLAMDQPYYKGEVILINSNELYYDADKVPVADANKLIEVFKTMDFFGPDYSNIAKIEVVDNKYLIRMVVHEDFWHDQDIMNSLESMKRMIEFDLGKPIDVKLESLSLSGVTKYKDL